MPATPQRLVGETVRFFLLLRLPVIGMGVSFQPSSRQAPRPLPDWGGRGWEGLVGADLLLEGGSQTGSCPRMEWRQRALTPLPSAAPGTRTPCPPGEGNLTGREEGKYQKMKPLKRQGPRILPLVCWVTQ